MKSTKGEIIGKVRPESMKEILAPVKDRMYRMIYVRGLCGGGKWDDSLGEWKISIPVENERGWMMVDYVVSSEKDYQTALGLYHKAFNFSEGKEEH